MDIVKYKSFAPVLSKRQRQNNNNTLSDYQTEVKD